MTDVPEDPVASAGGLRAAGELLRSGKITSEQMTLDYLTRIRALDPHLGAFEHVAHEQALETARAVDKLLASGTDLGPLMGMPVSVKDLFTVAGMPLTAGSRLDLSAIVDCREGPFIQSLRQAGCVLLGKTRMVEFAYGITGLSQPRGTPWNPCDHQVQRIPGGSSSGAGVAMAAGLCAVAIGTDTGGSVRVPAALCGVFGLKTTFGIWPTQGVFPLAPELDTIGLLTRSADDAAIFYADITRLLHGGNYKEIRPALLPGTILGVPKAYFWEDLTSEVSIVASRAVDLLVSAGVKFTQVSFPEASERESYFPISMPVQLLNTLGRERFEASRHLMDPVIAERTAQGLDILATQLLEVEMRRKRSASRALSRFQGVNAVVSPTTASAAPSVASLADYNEAYRQALNMTRNTQPANYLGLCAASLPMPVGAQGLPVGLQLMSPAGHEEGLLAIALSVEKALAGG
ncbi:amidase [Billgrantia pellis]|uniref:Amidase n=1 Tax=Billgrantia pellis TaxID=2606936 RepID=A0A7V7FY28_9GAMM|nr:amidase [Halomonas pellis]KAA0010252.1 amidase [Halomonas pellis]